jgi:hypothetical protein
VRAGTGIVTPAGAKGKCHPALPGWVPHLSASPASSQRATPSPCPSPSAIRSRSPASAARYAARASRDPWFFGYALAAYQQRHGLDDAALAREPG